MVELPCLYARSRVGFGCRRVLKVESRSNWETPSRTWRLEQMLLRCGQLAGIKAGTEMKEVGRLDNSSASVNLLWRAVFALPVLVASGSQGAAGTSYIGSGRECLGGYRARVMF
ncbi:hypothetical protein BJ508DRAFT_25893 [Ascobolus immersus RN42]|uniref:Uncharacterized protein n=1 Tax=Ascobolus immersus RN42 TaxID=1160509 RepID=A0A3N4IH03_ASCIM|nr:hypothetical protein BJ508DRAFT_25893 [Ascobolus immersus RN42]